MFDCYINAFDFINNSELDENYKWQIVAEFQSAFDLDAEDFAAVLRSAQQASSNLIDSKLTPFYALVKMAANNGESERIRDLFRALFQEDGGDLVLRQQKIDAFIAGCNALVEKHYPGSHLYMNDQRSAMGYLWLNDPDNYYYCKNAEAKYFANCAEFYDDWGTYANFDLRTFHRFCDELVAATKDYPPLMDAHNSRFVEANRLMHPDTNLHILIVDIIFCMGKYQLYSRARVAPRTPAEAKLYIERKNKAELLLRELNEAESNCQQLYAGREAIIALLEGGVPITHKAYGQASYLGTDKGYICLSFSSGEKKFTLASFINGFLEIDAPEFKNIISSYGKALSSEYTATQRLEHAKRALVPYEQYLD